MNPYEKISELENHESEDIQFLLKAFKLMRELAISHVYEMDNDEVAADLSAEEIIDNQFEERMCE